MSLKQIEKHSLSLTRAAENEQPYTTLKNLIFSSVADVCKTDWIDAINEIQYKNSEEKPSKLMSRLIASCRNKLDNDQGTRDVIERTLFACNPKSIQNILKAQNFVLLHNLGNFTNWFHGQTNSQSWVESVTSGSKTLAPVTNKIDELMHRNAQC